MRSDRQAEWLWGRRPVITVGARKASQRVKAVEAESSCSERPEHQLPRRLTDWLNPTGASKAHSLIDKVYKRKNLEMAWKKVKANRSAGGIDGENRQAVRRTAQ